MVKLTALQLNSVPDVDENLRVIARLLNELDIVKEHVVVLPECCLCFGGEDGELLSLAKQSKHSDYLQKKLASLARKYSVTLIAGSIPMLSANEEKFTNTCCAFSPLGQLLSKYHKIHLFDVEVTDNTQSYFESGFTSAGNELATVKTDYAHIGLSICYDLRFPELYRALANKGADIITVPSAFTAVTGKAHWQALLQARAIENQCYIVAAGQQGKHENGRETWGHSMIISPWGDILACLPEGVGSITASYDNDELKRVRQAMPINTHNQFKVELKNS